MYPLAHVVGHKVYSAGAPDSHGNPVGSWAAAVDVAVYGVAPSTQAEPGGTQVITGLTILAPKFAVDPRDRFVVNSLTYTVEGEVADWTQGPFGFTPGISFNLKRVEGGV